MSPDERQMLDDLFDRVQGAAATHRDPEAEELIAQRHREQPYATYYLAQAVIIQDQALKATTDRIQELEAQVRDLEDQTRRMPEPQNAGFLGAQQALRTGHVGNDEDDLGRVVGFLAGLDQGLKI